MNRVEPIRDPEHIQVIKDLLLHQSYRNYFLFVFGINSGLRISDMLPLRVMHVRYQEHLRIKESKTARTRRIKMTAGLKAEINKYIRGRADSDYLFPSKKGQQPISRMQAWQILNDVAKKADVEGPIGTHTLRKTFGAPR